MDLLLLAKVLWRKAWILIAIPLIAGFAAYLFTMNAQETYKSVAQISTGYTLNDQVHLAEEKFNIRDADVKFSNLLSMMNSSLAVNLLSYRLLLHDLNPVQVPYHRPDPNLYKLTGEEKDRAREIIEKRLSKLSPLAASDPDYPLLKKFLEGYGYTHAFVKEALSISRIPNTDYVQVEFTSDKAGLSALASNAYCEEFIRYYNSLKSTRSGESVEFLQQVVDQKKKERDLRAQALNDFKSMNNVVDPQSESGAKITQLSALEGQRDLVRSNIHRLELTIQRLNQDIRNASNPASGGSNQKILALREKINRMNERYIAGGSKDHRLVDSLDILREQWRAETDAVNRLGTTLGSGVTIADLQSQLKDAQISYQVERDNLNTLNSKISNVQYSLSGYASKEARVNALQKEYDLATEDYQAALTKFNEARNKMADANNTLRQALIAVPAASPETSKRIIIIALAGVTSFALCFFTIVALELIDGSVRTADKFKRIVNLPLAGTINRIDSRTFNIRAFFSQDNAGEDVEVFKSLLRKLRHEIESLNAKVILFTSPKRKDGKTFIMFSLSYVLSLINKRVLIIDTNFKNNSLSQLLGRNQSDLKVLDNKKHKLLTTAQGQKADGKHEEFERENNYDLINPTKYKNIYIVGNSGGGNESPAEILSGRDFSNLISALSDSFDYILLEGAALNDYSDTKELVRYADKVIAVFSADSSIKQLDRESIYYLKSLGKKFGGSVLNRVDTKDLKL